MLWFQPVLFAVAALALTACASPALHRSQVRRDRRGCAPGAEVCCRGDRKLRWVNDPKIKAWTEGQRATGDLAKHPTAWWGLQSTPMANVWRDK